MSQNNPNTTKPTQEMNKSSGVHQIESETLFKGGQRVDIVHNEAIYRLQITRQDKLILTK
ncbi:MAG: hemin uptake protein HemP [Arenicellales bacterium]